ncbi:hypothetical protein ELI13_36405 [Rhizobium ruizarguesonis]|uniref:Uncharacterized protein n=1 Tax=Rhizobium ruizarguesonis TaxID=2081791 RepID=A0ABY1X5R3_9HYPH|nr:hypothetical protein ELI48_30810 [Rhizobium ruizarguesonis]TAU57520.1 hypothetical protein ELI45_35600 [Rhizobium ruizarguesonis]TAU59339.1 hypothetical protein ELI46_37815 [Rhizobium ruizarguesonis]TAV03531.1 hypothetical protein ELI34_28315 [Rhizobium ruizarguesonis]TAV19727.1 hypothetical protein ELI36_36240 [Rhizobium ruizarguesonis]
MFLRECVEEGDLRDWRDWPSRGDVRVPFDQACKLATAIVNASFPSPPDTVPSSLTTDRFTLTS